MKEASFCVVPDLRPWNGDLRRNPAPYYIGKGISYTEHGFCNYVCSILRGRGISCRVEIVEA